MEMNLLTQGAEGKVYVSTWLGKSVIIKERFPKKYRHPDLDRTITKERMKAEARALARCQMIGLNTPALYDVDFDKGILIMEYFENSITIRNHLYTVMPNEKLHTQVIELAKKIGEIVAKLHDNHIIHGDLTTSNMMLKSPHEFSNIHLVDFGLSYIDERSEDKAVDLYVLERAILTTHSNSEEFVRCLLKSYENIGGLSASNVIKRLNDVRLRGRKKLCFG